MLPGTEVKTALGASFGGVLSQMTGLSPVVGAIGVASCALYACTQMSGRMLTLNRERKRDGGEKPSTGCGHPAGGR
jgi:hypothetical protein